MVSFVFLVFSFIFLPQTLQFEEAGYSDVCSQEVPCNSKKSLQCGPYNTCECNNGYMYIPAHEGCLPAPNSSNNWECINDSQCQHSELGALSYCHQKQCYCLREAMDGDMDKDVVRHENKCHFVNYKGETCSLDAQCEMSKNFKCIESGICDCDNERWHHFDARTGTHECLDNKSPLPCEYDIQCKTSTQGKFSRCNDNTNRCECADKDGERREVILVDGVCYVKKEIGDDCVSDVECQATIKGKAVCLGIKSAKGLCSCAGSHFYDILLQECLLEGVNEDSNCKTDRQCGLSTALGELSRCNPETGRCQCWDTLNNGNFDVAIYRLTNKCYYKKKQNEDCTLREECVLGYHRNADCLPHPAFNDGKVCQCPENQSCSGTGKLSLSFLLFITLAAALKS